MFQHPLNAHVRKKMNASLLFKAALLSEHDNEWYHQHNPPSNAYAAFYHIHSPLNTTPLTSLYLFNAIHQQNSSQNWQHYLLMYQQLTQAKVLATTFTHSLLIRSQSLYWGQLLGCHDDMGLFVRDSRSQSTAAYPTQGHGITWRQALKTEVSQNTHSPYVTSPIVVSLMTLSVFHGYEASTVGWKVNSGSSSFRTSLTK